jgi:hypothetical protein
MMMVAMGSVSDYSPAPCGIGIDHDSNQCICSAVWLLIRKGQLSFAFINGLCALRISTEIKRLVLFAGDAAIGFVRLPDQFFNLFQCHADLKFIEFTAGSWGTDNFPFDQSVSRLYHPYVCICSRSGGFLPGSAARQENQANNRYYQATAVHNVKPEDTICISAVSLNEAATINIRCVPRLISVLKFKQVAGDSTPKGRNAKPAARSKVKKHIIRQDYQGLLIYHEMYNQNWLIPLHA